jgi:hypothetical protein
MKPGLVCGTALLAGLLLAGCASSPPPRSSASTGARCLSRPDTSGTQPLIYLFCVQTN